MDVASLMVFGRRHLVFVKVQYVTFIVISTFADPKLKIQACFSEMFASINNICLQSTSKTHVSTYKRLLLVPRALCLFIGP